MRDKHKSRWLQSCRLTLSALALGQFIAAPVMADPFGFPGFPGFPGNGGHEARSPIKHVIVIIGENRSFDHVFATYVPNKHGESVDNLLSKGIIKLDANKNAVPGPNFQRAHQLAGQDTGPADQFLLSPPQTTFPNDQLPPPLVGGPKACSDTNFQQCLVTLSLAEQTENGLAPDYYQYLLTGASGQSSGAPDARITNVNALSAGPFALTGATMPYDSYSASPVHRFYQMWQQMNCNVEAANRDNPSGCGHNLFAWVEVTVGAGTNGKAQPSPFTNASTGEGSTALGFYNVQKGDVPYFTSLAQKYAMSDNFHQSVNGGTGANHIMFGHGDMIYFSDANGHPAVPPNNVTITGADVNGTSVVAEIENPNPAPGTNNWYSEDGYGGGGFGSTAFGGGSYTNCADTSQPGVEPIVSYLKSLRINPNCEPGRYYLMNNYNPGYFGNGKNAYTDTNVNNTPFTIPPSTRKSIGDSLNERGISWKYYGDQWNNYVNDPYQLNWASAGPNADEYCNICNPFQYDTSIMSHPDQVAAHIQDTVNLYSDIANHTLPAVSIAKPSGYVDGHPASSKLNLFEGFVKKIVDQVEASPYANDTAIFITFDEGGGYYDSGYVQPLDYFGDGTRIPLIVVSKHAIAGHISHNYSDHVSIIKFIERNWGLEPITNRSRDNYPNPIALPSNPYVPLNHPAISDLYDLFDFGQGFGFEQ
ncbi:alkaline phosphatase family protein [Bradyrhizobium sp.]|jgi:phospholipase C|uniref:alkaline phosphatase family protein n=1 Tax=Bradyrhizobium sp. TaxID=376 RepID=UPI002D363628|nr:alkaline phosphatase family protein [Bradyrhizobium sp.]HZR76162.1 alkaline phosphatase family protein [Bradyrhizobium sp.]